MKNRLSFIFVALACSIGTSQEVTSEWYNYGKSLFEAGGVNEYAACMFPDTTVTFQTSSGVLRPAIHSMGQVVDPSSDIWSDLGNTVIEDGNTFSVDSIRIPIYYMPNPQFNSDTLLVQLYRQSALEFSNFVVQGNGESIALPSYDYENNLGREADIELKYVLTSDDAVSNGREYIDIAIEDFVVDQNNVFAITTSFIPGTSYASGSELNSEFNTAGINAFYYKQYVDDNFIYESGKQNHGLFALSSARYNEAGAWNGLYIPGPLFNAGIYHNDISCKLTAIQDVSVETELFQEIDVFYSSLNKILLIRGIEGPADLLQVFIFDINGKIIQQESNLMNREMDMNGITPGVYIVKLLTDKGVISEKVMID